MRAKAKDTILQQGDATMKEDIFILGLCNLAFNVFSLRHIPPGVDVTRAKAMCAKAKMTKSCCMVFCPFPTSQMCLNQNPLC